MLRRHRQVRTQLNQLKDTGLFALALWLAHFARERWEADPLGLASSLYNTLRWEVFNPTKQIEPFSAFAWLYIALIPGVPLILELQGFYNRALVARRRETAWKLFKACFITTIAVILITFFRKEQPARSVFPLFGLFSFLLVYASEEVLRGIYKRRARRSGFRRKFVLIGSPADTAALHQYVRSKPEEGIDILCQIDLNERPLDELMNLLHENSASGIIINARHTYFGEIEKAIQACELEGLEVWLMADFFKTQISRTSFDDFHGRPMLVFHSAPDVSWQSVAKRGVDIVCGVVLLTLSLPFLVLFAWLIRRSSPGPALFRQKRCGLHGEPFTMLKFRTMVTDAEQRKQELAALNEMSGPVFKVTNDPRVTKIGRFLRKYSIDEWPQLVNVLRGEMSLVGPRPLPVDEVRMFDDMAHRRRLSVKPGLTCLWQISGRNEVRDFRDWVRLDLEYIDNWSLWLDFKILVRTIPVVLIGTGAK